MPDRDTPHSSATGVFRPASAVAPDYAVAYVTSSARSGSTILDMMLGAHSSACSVGQLDQLAEWVANDDACTCGVALGACRLWSTILGEHPSVEDPALPGPLNLDGQVRKGWAILGAALSKRVPDTAREVATATWDLVDAVVEATGCTMVVDSSKSLVRLARLDSDPERGPRIRVVHLVRDLRGVVASRTTAKPAPSAGGHVGVTPADPTWRVVRDWLVQHSLTYLLGVTRFRGRYLVLTYEDLVARPEEVLARVAAFLDRAFEPGMLPPMDRRDFHLVGGNSSRLSFDALRPDTSWHERLSPGRQRLLGVAQAPLYGLLRRRARRTAP